ncbi:MAG: lactate utilization protein [Pseudomonadota bacterium]
MSVRSSVAAREATLGAIRSSLSVAADDAERRVAVLKRLYDHESNLVPARAHEETAALIARFVSMLRGQSADVFGVRDISAVPATIAAFLRNANLPARVQHGADPLFDALDWDAAPGIERTQGRAEAETPTGLSRAFAGAAETGTLMMVSGPENPTTLNFLPETHIVIIDRAQIVGSYEDAWAALRTRYGEREMPRTVNFISGPSRTADIEQTLTLGAHGPKRLCVIVTGVEDV